MNDKTNVTKQINPYKIIYPILIGLAVVSYMLYDEFDYNAFANIVFTWKSAFWIFVAFFCMFLRDFGYVVRLRCLSNNKLTWKQCIRVIFLWEFASAVTPSAAGGTTVAVIFVNKEGINIGKSSTIVMATSFLDELYFIVMFPIILLTVNDLLLDNGLQLWTLQGVDSTISSSLMWFAIIGYTIKFGYTFALGYGLFINPLRLKSLLLFIFRLPFLRKWKRGAEITGNEIIRNSQNLRNQPLKFWVKAIGATFFGWTARYWIVNALLVAFWASRYGWGEHFLIFARQFVMWIMMIVSPTPGGSGFAEYVFSRYLGDFLPVVGLSVAMAILWRLISYYPYLIAGVFIVPQWVAKNFGKTPKKRERKKIIQSQTEENVLNIDENGKNV